MSSTSNCSVLNCTNASKSLSSDNEKKVYFYNFPKEAKTFLKWILFTGRGINWRPTSDSQKLCSDHFQESAFIENEEEFPSYKRKFLKSNAIPTIVTLDECGDDDVEYVMEEDSDEEDNLDLRTVQERVSTVQERVTRTTTDSQKRRSKDNAEIFENLATKKPRSKESQSEVGKTDGKRQFAQQFMEFVGVYDSSTQAKQLSQNHESKNKSVVPECSTTHEKQTSTNNTAKNNHNMHVNDMSDDESNDEENENLIDAVNAKLNRVEKTLLNVLDQIDIIRKDVMKIVNSTQNSKSTDKAVKTASHESGNLSTNRNKNVSMYLKEDQRSRIKKPISSTQSQSNKFSKRFPIQSTDEFEEFNAELDTSSELVQFTINKFKQTNDSRVEIFVEENLKNLIDENVAKSMSWSGLHSDFAVKNAPIVVLLRDALVTRFNCQIKSPAVNLIRLYFGK